MRADATDEARVESTSVLDAIFGTWHRRKWVGLAVFVIILAGAATIARVLPDVYRATATVLVERQNVSETFVKSSVSAELETRLQTISQEVLSRARLADLIGRLRLYPELGGGAPTEGAIQKLRRDILLELKGVQQTSGRPATVAFNLTYQGRDPETVARVANALAAFYVEENGRLREQQAAGTASFLKLQLGQARTRLEEQEQRVRDFRLRHVGELPQQLAVNMATLERLQAQLDLNGANQLRAMDRREALTRDAAETETRVMPDKPAAKPEAAVVSGIAKLRQNLAELRRRYTDKHPDVIALKAEIAALEANGAEEPAAPAEPTPVPQVAPPAERPSRLTASISKLDAEIDALKMQAQRIQAQISDYQKRVESAPEREQELQRLTANYEMAKELYGSLLKRYEDAQLAENMEQSRRGERFRILDPAIPPRHPTAPNRTLLFFVGTLVAAGAAIAAMILTEQLGSAFHTVDDVRAMTAAPVLVSIPLIVTDADRRRSRRRAGLVAVGVALAVVAAINAARYVADGNEQLLTLVARDAARMTKQ
jgi:polysaccharide chain length determinant protein (PEP-CTERM system associated)